MFTRTLTSEVTSLEQIRTFLEGSGVVRFAGQRREEVYAWTERTLVWHQYPALNRPEKGLVRRYIARLTDLSRAQVTRMIAGYVETGRVKAVPYQRRKFAALYTKADVELLAYVDTGHGNLSGPATKRILEREYANIARQLSSAWRGSQWRRSTGSATRKLIAGAIPATSRPDRR